MPKTEKQNCLKKEKNLSLKKNAIKKNSKSRQTTRKWLKQCKNKVSVSFVKAGILERIIKEGRRVCFTL